MELNGKFIKFLLNICLIIWLSIWFILCNAAPPISSIWLPINELTDEFDGVTLNQSKWDDHNPKWKGRHPGLYSPSNVSVKDGQLVLRARAESLPESMLPYRDFTTSAVKSKQRVLYGYFEIRAKPMKSRVASAFWFYDSQPEHWTEIDVFEMGPLVPGHERAYHMNVHIFRVPGFQGTIKDHMRFQKDWIAPWPLADDFHLYGLEWDEKHIRWYVDDKVVREIENVYCHYPLHMNFDTETMPDWLGLPSQAELPAEFRIDYVRSWKKVGPRAPAQEQGAE